MKKGRLLAEPAPDHSVTQFTMIEMLCGIIRW